MTNVDFEPLSTIKKPSALPSEKATPEETRLELEQDRLALGQQKLAQKCRVAAMNKLARREHSKKELWLKLNAQKEKLIQRALAESAGPSWEESVDEQTLNAALREAFAALLDQSLSKLEQEGLLSDERFAEAYLNMRANAGFGPEKIKLELNQRGIASVDWVVEARDWRAALRDVIDRKTNGRALRSKNERASLQRFLTHRGFKASDIGAELRGRS